MPVFDANFVLVAALVGVVLLGVVWFAVRFWLAATRPPNIPDVRSAAIDQLNRQALEQMGAGGKEEAAGEAPGVENSDVPSELKRIVP